MSSLLELFGGYSTASSTATSAAAAYGASSELAVTAPFLTIAATQALSAAVVAAAKVQRQLGSAHGVVDSATAIVASVSCPEASTFGAYAAGVGSAALAYRFRALPRNLRNRWFASRRHGAYGHAAACDVVLHRQGYAVGYRYDVKAPAWASLIVCQRSTVAAEKRTTNPFAIDPSVAESKQVAPDCFINSGWDRGHVAPRAAVAFSSEASDESFYMTNIVAQHPALNRGAWSRLERQVRRWTQQHGPLAVVVGPVFDTPEPAAAVGARTWFSTRLFSRTVCPLVRPAATKQKKASEATDFVVPKGFFMAVTSLRNPAKPIAFYFDNNAAAAEAARGKDLVNDVAISVDELERRTKGAVAVFKKAPLWRRPRAWQRLSVDRNFWSSGPADAAAE